MESPQATLRLRLILGKFRCVMVSGRVVTIDLGYGVRMEITVPHDRFDLRPGDLLTYYTEVPLVQP